MIRKQQQGNIIITVLIVLLLAMIIGSGLVNHLLVSESRAVNESLAKRQVYWAMKGYQNYFFSRAKQIYNYLEVPQNPILFTGYGYHIDFDPSDDSPSATDFLGKFNGFVTPETQPDCTEIKDSDDLLACIHQEFMDSSLDVWDYGTNYSFQIEILFITDANGQKMEIDLSDSDSIPSLSGLDNRMRNLVSVSELDDANGVLLKEQYLLSQ